MVLTGGDFLATERYGVAKLNFGDRVGASAPELPVRHQTAEDLAVVLVRARIIDLDIGQPDTLFYRRVLAGRRELYFFLVRRAHAGRQERSCDQENCEQSGKDKRSKTRGLDHNIRDFKCDD